MDRATPLEMGKSLSLVDTMKKFGMPFIPVPYFNLKQRDKLIQQLQKQLKLLEKKIETEKE